jgi:hypothetical protein
VPFISIHAEIVSQTELIWQYPAAVIADPELTRVFLFTSCFRRNNFINYYNQGVNW